VNLGGVLHNRAAIGGRGADGDPPAVLELAERARRLAPTNSRAYVLAGLANLTGGHPTIAVDRFSRALELDSRDVITRFRLGEARWELDDQAHALADWRTADAGPLVLELGVAASRQRQYEQALEYLRAATSIEPGAFAGWLQTANVLATLTRYDDARQGYEEAIRRFPTRPEAYARLAELLGRQLEQPAAAERLLQRGLASASPPHDRLYLVGSRLAADRDDFAQAERYVRMALRLNPREGAYLAALGDLYYQQGRFPEAIEQYRYAGTNAHQPAWRWLSRQRIGRVRVAQDDWDAAIAEYRAAVAVSEAESAEPQVVAGNYVALGDVLARAGNGREAEAAYRAARRRDPTNQAAAGRLQAPPNR